MLDPVLVATSGAMLADDATIAALARLVALATLVTPNLPELAALGGEEGLAGTILVKGGHAEGDTITDRLIGPTGEIARWTNPRIETRHTHGTGCTLASAIATGLGRGMDLTDAIGRGIAFVRASIAAAPGLGHGHGPMGQQHATGFACPA